MEKQRLDRLITERGMFTSRARAQQAILDGIVFVDGTKAEKTGLAVDENARIELRGEALKYVSRGGLKLKKALDAFTIRLCGAVAADIGASAGGFTDCMLQNGAAHVFAIDVGTGQLADALRGDARVSVMENTDVRSVTKTMLGCELDFASIDVSFISLSLVLPAVYGLMRNGAQAVALVKPQFEAGRGRIGKNGVVRDPNVHAAVLEKFIGDAQKAGFAVIAADYSPIRGPEGNIEYLALLQKDGRNCAINVAELVRKSHETLAKGR